MIGPGGFARLGVLAVVCVAFGVACAGRSLDKTERDPGAGGGGTRGGGTHGGGATASGGTSVTGGAPAIGGGTGSGAGGSGTAGGATTSVAGCFSRRIGPLPTPGPSCGNGVHDYGEECDDFNVQSRDGCTASCLVEADSACPLVGPCVLEPCGNGRVARHEACDDGNSVDGDGCSGVCELESGWYCPGEGLRCRPVCGDGMLAGGEECDDGNALSGDGCSRVCLVERPLCELDAGAAGAAGVGGAADEAPPGNEESGRVACVVPVCGDGVVTAPEDCDDGRQGNDGRYGGCQPDCTFAEYCGNGVVSLLEDCDLPGSTLGYGEGQCTPACHFAPYCGDGSIDARAGEECDYGACAQPSCDHQCRVPVR